MSAAESVDRWAEPPEHTDQCTCVLCEGMRAGLASSGGTAPRRAAWSPSALPPLSELLADVGPTPCRSCRIAVVERPGVCDACVRVVAAKERARVVGFARQTIPEGLRDRTLESVVPYAHPAALAAVQALFGVELPRGLALVGPSGAAKTSLMVGMLQRLHDRAASIDAPESLYELGRGAFFVAADELKTECEERRWKHDVPPLLTMARNATILFLDEVHMGGPDVFAVVQRRVNRGRTTVITTWQTREETARAMGDGFARRVYERVIDCPIRVVTP